MAAAEATTLPTTGPEEGVDQPDRWPSKERRAAQSWLGHLPIQWQLIGGFGIILVVLSLAGYWTAHILNTHDDAYTALIDGSATETLLAEQMQTVLLQQAEALKDMLLRGDDPTAFQKYTTRFDDDTVQLRELRARMDALPRLTTQDRDLLHQFDTSWAAYLAAWPKAQAAYKAGSHTGADSLMRGQYPAAAAAASTLAVQLESRNHAEAAQLAADTDTTTGVVLPLFGFVTLVGIIIAWMITRTVTREVSTAAKQLLESSRGILDAVERQTTAASEQADVLGQTTDMVGQITEAAEQITRRAMEICQEEQGESKVAGRDLAAVKTAMATFASVPQRVEIMNSRTLDLTAQCEQLSEVITRLDERARQHSMMVLTVLLQGRGQDDDGLRAQALAAEMADLVEHASTVTSQAWPVLAEVKRLTRQAATTLTHESAPVDQHVAVIEQTIHDLSNDLRGAVQSARHIAAAAERHSAATARIAAAMGAVNRTAEDNLQVAMSVREAAGRLNELARHLHWLISRDGRTARARHS